MPSNQRPTWTNVGDIDRTDGPMAAKLAALYFGDPLEWQRFVLDAMVARNLEDKYLHHSFGLSVPRQNGKSWDVLARCFYGIVSDGERILYTCQHGDTSDEMFRRLCEPFENEDNEELHELLLTVRKTNGQQAIYLKNGGYIRFTTRTNSLARGRSYDVIIYDEAQELTDEQQAASLFAISASRKHNTQTIYIGTPPEPSCPGEVFRRLHDDAHAQAPQAIPWMEWAVTEIGDVTDRVRWRRVNPSQGILIDETAIEGELGTLADTFARERLGWWSPVARAEKAIPDRAWDASSIDGIGDRFRAKTALAVKFSPDGSSYALAGCKLDGKGRAAVELVELGSTAGGTKALASALHERRSKVAVVVVDGMSGADALCENLAELQAPRGYASKPTAQDVIAAATGFVDSLADGSLFHTAQQALDDSAKHASKRQIGKRGGWGFGSSGGHDSTAVEACALALWGARTTKRNPRRKQRLL